MARRQTSSAIEVVVPIGYDRIDRSNRADVTERIARHLRGHDDGSPRLVLDMAGVAFIDSAGLRVLIALQQRLADEDSELVLRNTTRLVRRAIEILNLTYDIRIEASAASGSRCTGPTTSEGRDVSNA